MDLNIQALNGLLTQLIHGINTLNNTVANIATTQTAILEEQTAQRNEQTAIRNEFTRTVEQQTGIRHDITELRQLTQENFARVNLLENQLLTLRQPPTVTAPIPHPTPALTLPLSPPPISPVYPQPIPPRANEAVPHPTPALPITPPPFPGPRPLTLSFPHPIPPTLPLTTTQSPPLITLNIGSPPKRLPAQPIIGGIVPPEINTDLTQNGDNWARVAENKMRTENPAEYAKIAASPDFDPRYFTLVGDGGALAPGSAIYVKDMGLTARARNKVLWTPFLWTQLDERQQRNQRRYPDRMLLITSPYQGRDPVRNIKMGNAVQLANTVVTSNPKKKIVNRGISTLIRELGADTIPIQPHTRAIFSPYVVTQPELLAQFPVEQLGHMRHTAIFSGLVHDYTFTLGDVIPDSLETFRAAIIRGVNHVLQLTADQPVQAWYLLLNYASGNGGAKQISTVTTVRHNILEHIYTRNIGENYLDEVEILGSDADPEAREELRSYFVDLSTFTIRVLDPIRVGGGITRAAEEWLQRCIQGQVTSKNYSACSLEWGKIVNYSSANNGCFFKILYEVIKKNNGVKPASSYKALWKNFDEFFGLKTYGKELPFEDAIRASSWKSFNLQIFNVDGVIIAAGLETSPPQQILRVLYHEKHYFLVSEYHPTLVDNPPIGQPISSNTKTKSINLSALICYYDLETVYSCGIGEEHVEMPYALAHITTDLDNNELIRDTIVVNSPGFHIFDYLLTSCTNLALNRLANGPAEFERSMNIPEQPLTDKQAKIISDIQQVIHQSTSTPHVPSYPPIRLSEGVTGSTSRPVIYNITLRMTAFNGAKFDHWLLFRYLLGRGFKCITAPSSKANTFKFLIYSNTPTAGEYRANPTNTHNTRGEVYGKVYLEVWDPCQFLFTSLNKAAIAFNLPIEKGDFNHNEVQHAYAEGRLEEYLLQHPVNNYVIRDVEILREVSVRFRQACLEAVKKDPLNAPTMASFGWGILSEIHEESGHTDRLQVVPWIRLLTTNGKYIPPTPETMGVTHLGVKEKAKQMRGAKKSIEYDLKKKMQNYLRSAIVGGRVQGIVGDHVRPKDDPLYMVDVVSEYPTVMISGRYPSGTPTLLFNDDENSRSWRNTAFSNAEFIGMYYCRYNQRVLIERTGYVYLPLRIEGHPLKWDNESVLAAGDQEGLLPDVSIRRLLMEGCHVEFAIPTDTQLPHSIIWHATNDTFRDYINLFAKIKSDEDAKPADQRNMAMRELGKLGMNGVSGKASQRQFDSKNVIYSSEEVEKAREEITQRIHQALNQPFSGAKHPEKENFRDGVPKFADTPDIVLIAKNFMMMKVKHYGSKLYPVQLSCFIYAYARDLMWEDIYSRAYLFGGAVWYSDTDSAVINRAQLQDLANRGRLVQNNKKEFGLFELEAEISRIVVAAPKFYALTKTDGSEKLRIKGIRSTDEYLVNGEFRPITGNGVDLLVRKVNGEPITIKSYSIYRQNGKVMYRDLIKQL